MQYEYDYWGNQVESDNNGKLNGQSLVYVGGTATVGKSNTITSTLYGVAGGCVLGAGNGNADVENSGKVNNTHIIINDQAHILNSVYGGGNYGSVGAQSSSNTSTR